MPYMCRSLSLYRQLAAKKLNRTNTLHCPSSNKRRRRKYSRSCMAHTKTNTRIICLSALAVMATLLLSSDALGLLKPYFSIIAYILLTRNLWKFTLEQLCVRSCVQCDSELQWERGRGMHPPVRGAEWVRRQGLLQRQQPVLLSA